MIETMREVVIWACMIFLGAILIGTCLYYCFSDDTKKEAKKMSKNEEIKNLNDKIYKLEKELETLREYFEAKFFLHDFKWTDIKNEKLREETKQAIEHHAEWEFAHTKNYSPTKEFIGRVEIIQRALDKDAEIEKYTKKGEKRC